MLSNSQIGQSFKRVDLDGIFSTSRFSQSREGIVSIDDRIVLFCTLEKELRKEQFHYNVYSS